MNYVANAPTRESSTWVAFLEAFKVIINKFEKIYAEAGAAGLVEHEVMGKLSRAPEERLRIQDLADLMLVSKSGASRIIDRMEEQGLVRREKSSIDRRVVYTILTPKGEEALSLSRKVWNKAYEESFVDILGDEDLRQFHQLLLRMIKANLTSETEDSALVGAFSR